ncbi:hypothetical protein [Treponema sp.]|uniref:hypothetical protein n=1 Tax=Treponema sp. TaxID=166 RepID=UPI0025DE83F3|nr:hypothetical protein [Treponema sp.]MBR4322367.1 hypothetical protein [Treponema sp.]
MGIDSSKKNPNKEIAEGLTKVFARKLATNEKIDVLTILRYNDVYYNVLITIIDKKTGKVTQREDTLSYETCTFCIKSGFLKKLPI